MPHTFKANDIARIIVGDHLVSVASCRFGIEQLVTVDWVQGAKHRHKEFPASELKYVKPWKRPNEPAYVKESLERFLSSNPRRSR